MSDSQFSIIKDSPIPVYYQIYSSLKKQILVQAIQDGQGRLPSERELAERFDVTRVTLRQAMAELEKDSLIRRDKGKRPIVNSQPKPFLHTLRLPSGRGFGQNFVDSQPEILQLERFEETFESISEQFNGYQGPIYFIKRIMKVMGAPVALNRIWIPEQFAPGLDHVGLCVDSSLSKTLLEHYGLQLIHRTNIVESVRPSLADIELLKISVDSLMLQIKSMSYTTDDLPYEFSITTWLGDVVRLKVDIADIDNGLELSDGLYQKSAL